MGSRERNDKSSDGTQAARDDGSAETPISCGFNPIKFDPIQSNPAQSNLGLAIRVSQTGSSRSPKSSRVASSCEKDMYNRVNDFFTACYLMRSVLSPQVDCNSSSCDKYSVTRKCLNDRKGKKETEHSRCRELLSNLECRLVEENLGTLSKAGQMDG